MSSRGAYSLRAFLLTVWFLLPSPPSSAGVMVPFASQGMFDFTETAEMAINYATAYLKREATEGPTGQQLRLRGSSKAALDNLERQLQPAPGDLNLRTALGIMLWGSSRQKEAQGIFEQSVRANLSYAIGHCYLAMFALSEKDMSGAERHFEEAIQADPTYVPAYNSLAMIYNKVGKIDAALRILTEGIARLPNETSFFYNQATIYGSHENWEAAQVSQQHALSRQPTQENRLFLGAILLKRQDYSGAQAVFESMLDRNPKNVLALLGLAKTYKERHDFAMAIRLSEQALAIDPANEEIKAEVQEHKEAYDKWQSQQKDKKEGRE